MSKKVARRSALGVLLAAWWGTAQGRDRLTWYDAGILAGLGLGWWLEKKAGKDSDEGQAEDGKEGRA